MESGLMFIVFGLIFGLGFFFALTLQAIKWKVEKKDEIKLFTRDVLIARGIKVIEMVLVLIALIFIAGPDGWIYQDFQHYQEQVVCIPNEWSATFYPIGRNIHNYKIEYANNKTTVFDGSNKTSINASDLFEYFQDVPVKPEDKEELYKNIKEIGN